MFSWYMKYILALAMQSVIKMDMHMQSLWPNSVLSLVWGLINVTHDHGFGFYQHKTIVNIKKC